MCDDALSVDTTELLRPILKPPKHAIISDNNVTSAPKKTSKGDMKLPPFCNHTRVCDTTVYNLDKRSVAIDTAKTIRRESSSSSVDMNVTFPIKSVAMLSSRCEDEESVATAELVRRIRQPVVDCCDPPLMVATNRVAFSTCNTLNDDNATMNDLVEPVMPDFPGNIMEIHIHATTGLEHDCDEKGDEEFALPEQCDRSEERRVGKEC